MDQLLIQLSKSVSSAKTVEDLSRPLLEMLEAVTGLESTYLTMVDLERSLQHVLFSQNKKQLQIPEGLSVPWEDTLCKRALDEGRPYTNEVDQLWGDSGAARELGIQTYVSTPVRMDDGSLYGTLCAASASKLQLPPNAEHILQLFADLIGKHIQREILLEQLAKANEELSAYASTDALTGLPNRRALITELKRSLARALRNKTSLLIGFLDLDDFKKINDRHGHDIGDEFLCAISNRITGALRADDFLARLGGDEFIVVGVGPVANDDIALAITTFKERLTKCTMGKFPLSRIEIDYRGASVGVVSVDTSTASPEDALKQADLAMYETKQLRRIGASSSVSNIAAKET